MKATYIKASKDLEILQMAEEGLKDYQEHLINLEKL
jgi:hypothetical protein